MDKGKIKNLVVNNKNKLVIALTILLISILLISIITYATSNQDYVVEVKDNGSENIAQNSDSSVTKKIVSENTKNLTYEVAINNLKTRSTNPEVAVLIDTSSSMEINDIETQVKPKAIEFVRGLLTDVNGVRISISNNHEVKAGLGAVTTTNYTSHINDLVAGEGSNLSDGIDKAVSTFSTTENEKYLIIFSDATDSVLEKLQLTVNNGINVYSILTDITNNEYTQNPETVGNVQMISDIESFSPIYNKINNSIINVKVKDIFTAETNEYFTLTKATNNPADVIFTKTEDGYELECADIKAGETKKVQFTLTINEDSKIDSRKIYTDLNTSSKMTIDYDNCTGDKINYEMEHSPIYIICKKYSLTIKAVSEKSDKLPVSDLDIQVIGKRTNDEEGNPVKGTIVFDEILKTNSKGEIIVDNLKTLGDITFEIKPLVNQIGYSDTSATTIIVHNRPADNGLTATADVGKEPVVNNTTRDILVELPITVQTLAINIDTIDRDNSNVKLGNIEYRLIQPKLNSKYEMEALYGTTDAQGKLTFRPTVMTKDGTYEYILSQLTEQDGYDSMGNVTLIVKFENGKIVENGFKHKYNDNIETKRVSEYVGNVTVKNESENSDTFKLEINVMDSVNDTKRLEGAVYDLELTRVASNGQQIKNTIFGVTTDENGKIELNLPGKGYLSLKVRETKPATGYHADTQEKTIIFTRVQGRVDQVSRVLPDGITNINALPDSDANALVVNIKSVERAGKNRVQIHLIDKDEQDINLLGVSLTLIDVATNKNYTGITDENGIVNFLVDDKEAGQYPFDIMLTNGSPYGYINSENKLGRISIQYGDDKYINDCSDLPPYSVQVFQPDISVDSEDFEYHTAKVKIGLTPDSANTNNLQVKLVDDQNKPIEGAKYDITIESGDIVRKIIGRLTDKNGMLSTKLIGTDVITIKIKETETIKGHVINNQEQIIDLRKENGAYVIDNQEPYKDYDGTTQKIGAEISGKTVIYHDVNKPKTGNNTLLNLYVYKKDINNNYVGNVRTVLTSETLKLGGSAITESTNYTGIAKSGKTFTLNPAITDTKDHVGYFEVEGIEVNGAELNNGERVDYLYMYEVDANGKVLENTKITLKLTFRYNKEKEIIQITNVEATWGNRLITKREFSGYETSVAYESNVYLDIYTNYDDVGNFALNLEKIGKNQNKLYGAKYDVIVTRPDGTTVVRKGIDITDETEFTGIFVSAGTRIEITEVEAPIGYELNEYTEILTIKSVDPVTGQIEVEMEKSGYSTPRAKLEPLQETILEDGTYKTEAKLVLTDYELDTFKFGIKTQEANTKNPIQGYKFTISSDQGAQATTKETDSEGKTATLVGANYEEEDYIVTYRVENIKAAEYFKKLSSTIEVKVVFDLNGEVKSEATLQANKSLAGYGSIWEIESTRKSKENENDINIVINVEPQEKLIVNIITEDILSKQQLTNAEYEITPSITKAIGTTKIEVGYVLPNGANTYTIKHTNVVNDYMKISDKAFKITYDENGDISTQIPPETSSEGMSIVSYSGKEITIKIQIEPEVPFVITNKSYFGDNLLANSKFEITLENVASKTSITNPQGNAISYVGKFGNNEEITYIIKQVSAHEGYALVPEFRVKVTYDENRNITNAQIEGNVNDNVVFAIASTIQPSTTTDVGYRGNPNGIVNIQVKNYPEVQFNIQNLDKQDKTTVLYGAIYEVTSTIPTKEDGAMVDETGTAVAHLDRGAFNTTVEYTIKELNPSPRYQTMLADAVIEVDFDENGFIINTPRVTKLNDIVLASIPTQNAQEDKFKVDIKILSNPKLAITINKIDEESNQPLEKVDFEITARIEKENLANFTEEIRNKIILDSAEITEEEYLSQLFDRLKINPETIQNSKRDIAVYNTYNELTNLTDDEINRFANAVNTTDRINILVETGKVTREDINNNIDKVTNKNIIDELIKCNLFTQDMVNEELAKLKSLVRIDRTVATTNKLGQAVAYVDKTLASKTIEYTIKEIRKAEGYDWPDEPIIIKVTYDETGKMIANNPIEVVSGDINIDSFDINNYAVTTTITNKASKEVKIHLTVEDAYDSRKKLETAEFDAYLVDTTNGISYTPDNKYRTYLESGSVEDSTGKGIAHGEDTESIGVYKEGTGSRILRLEQKKTPNQYYLGNDKYESIYQSIPYALLVNVSFNDEGSVLNASIYNPRGDTKQIGYIAGGRYIEVSNTRNTINVTIKYYPMLQVQMITQDMYTGDALSARYTVATNLYGSALSGIVRSGYIDPYYVREEDYKDDEKPHEYRGRTYNMSYTTDATLNTKDETKAGELYGAVRKEVSPTEADNDPTYNIDTRERVIYVYEEQEPTSPIQYQKYRPRKLGHPVEKLIATIKVYYDELGQIEKTEVLETKSHNNIKDNFFTLVEAKVNEYTIQITVKYSPITTITTTVVDEISGKGLSGIRIAPYINNTEVTNKSYEFRTQSYYTTGSNGVTGWTYWGASVNGGQVRYEMDSYTVGTGYNGYLDPGKIILDVAYDENGRVSGVTPRSTDQYGDTNAIDISWENNDIKVTIPYSRRFNVKLNKVDYYDSNTKLGAVFKVVTSENAEVSVAANSINTIGKVYAGKTVRYTLSETTAPYGYIPVNNLDFYVTFNNDGTVRNASSTSDFYQFVKSAPADNDINRVNKTDLEANIKNKPRFNISIDLSDKIYPELKLEGATFTMTNNKGDVAQGEVKTDRNGYLETYIGPIYPAEEVEYTIVQTKEVNGYYPNNSIVKFKVKFNESGKIESYSLINGQDVVTIDPNKFVNTKSIHLAMTNMPKDIKIGVHKYDKLTGEAMDTIKFNVKAEVPGKVAKDTLITTNDKGNVVGKIDTFEESSSYKVVKYTISEIEVPNTYRKIQNVVIQVTYNQDGSMFAYEILSNESNVRVQVATKKQIKFLDGIPVHIKLEIPNDNAYDLIIKNEDRNYEGLGIEGTKYDVTINGIETNLEPTDANGYTRSINRTEKGEITIKVTERNVGEGYRPEPNNETTIVLKKGEQVYSLALDPVNGNSNPTYAEVVVDEDYGTVTVIFKNETKLELNLAKDDINTGTPLEGAIFAITSEEIDNNGNTVENTLKAITNTKLVNTTNDNGTTSERYQIDENEKTDYNGRFYLDLGLAYQNKIIKYTLTEVVTPEGYTEIVPITVTVKFDAYGRITEIVDDSFRAQCYLESNTGKSHNMIFNISNGTVNPQYTVKIVSVDSQTGMRINGSVFQVEVTNSAEDIYKKEVTGTTRDVSKTINNKTFISERGVMKVTGIQAEGDITISLNQVETATGYVFGKTNKVAGNVIANAEFTVSASELEKDVTLSKKDDGGFEVSVDNTNREIIIKVKNDPELKFDITKFDGKTKQKLSGAEFTVTSVVQTTATTVDTTLNEKSVKTDENGHTTLNGGIIQAGRTMIYTLKENKLDYYNQMDDIVILVQYDTKGNIMYHEILSDGNDAKIRVDGDAKMQETKRILGASDVPGIVEVDYVTYDIPTGIGTKILQLDVFNTQESANIPDEYQVIIEKHHIDDEEYPYFIPGVTFEISVLQEYGKAETKWVDTTDEHGIIKSQYFNGYGNITVKIREIATIDGFKLDIQTKTLKFTRDRETHKLEFVSLDPENIGYEFSDDQTQVILKPVNEIATNTYSMILNKIDKNSNILIGDNQAEFEITRIEKYETLTPVENEETGEIVYDSETQEIKQIIVKESTDEKGILVVNNLLAPEEGTYRYVIKETKAPEGYVQLAEDIELDITFAKDESDELIITNVEVVKGNDNIKIAKQKEQLLNLIILNTNEKDVTQDGEYKFNIVKVDNENNAITTDTAVFKLTNIQTNEVNYYETNEQGKLEIPTFKMPEEEGKYIYKLNEVKAPNGYVLNVNDIMLELEFAKDEEGKIYLKDVQVQGNNIEYEAPEEGNLPDTTIIIKIANEKGGAGTGNTNDKRYTFVLNKVDLVTKEIISQNVEFEVMLANGEIVKGKTNDNGQLRIEDVFMPAELGEYELVIKEITTPSGYIVDNEPKNVKVTFTGYGENMVISDIKLADANNKNIEILQDKCSDQYVEVNILNEKENKQKLYVISKKYNKDYKFYDELLEGYNNKSPIYDEGEDVYEILDYFYGVYADKGNKKGQALTPAYTIDKPFIDTKIAKGDNKTVLVEEFIGNLESNGHMVVLDQNGNELGPKDIVATGMILRSTLDDQELTFDIVVKGDGYKASNEKKPGRVNTGDKNALIKYIAGDTTYVTDPLQLRALDIDMDGRLNTSDKREITEIIAYDAERTPLPYYETWSNSNILSDKKHIQYVTKEEYENQQN
ncbi:MAG: hypothetical protein HFJ41_04190 [Clostridia bacterium]|nr:hypothetical protein [Clostridia bacterium]